MRPFSIILILLFPLIGFTQTDVEPLKIVTDRPSFSASSRAVPHKSLQIETGLIMNVLKNEDAAVSKTTLYSYPTPMLRWGVLKGAELRIFNTFYTKNTEYSGLQEKGQTNSGFGNLIVGTKINLTGQKGIRPEIAVLSHLSFPTGNSIVKEFDKLQFDIELSFSHALSEKFSLGYNLGWIYTEGLKNGNGIYSLIFGYGISDKFGVYLEGYGLFPDLNSMTYNLDAGVTYLLKPRIQFDIAASKSFSIDNYYITFGFSILFAKLY